MSILTFTSEQNARLVASSLHARKASSNILAFTSLASTPHKTPIKPNDLQGWHCNISQKFIFSRHHPQQLQIRPGVKCSQYDLLCKLLIAGTCNTIYIDVQLNKLELDYVRRLQSASSTHIVNARIAYAFAPKHQLHA